MSRKADLPAEEGETEVYAFGIECWLSSALQAAILFVVGLLTQKLVEIIAVSVCFTGVKKHVGGWHANHHWSCLTVGTATMLCAVLLGIITPWWVGYWLLIGANVIIYLLAPIPHANNPKTLEELHKSRRYALVMSYLLTLIIGLLLPTSFARYAVQGAYGLAMVAISLLVPNRGGEEVEKRLETGC